MTPKTAPPRIVFVANSLRVGGSQTVLLELVEIAVADGWDVVVATRGGMLRDTFTAAEARCVDLVMREGVAPQSPLALHPVEIAKTSACAVGVAQLARLLGGKQPTIVHASQPWPLFVAAAACRITGRPLVWHVHGTTPVETPPPFRHFVTRQVNVTVGVCPTAQEKAVTLVAGGRVLTFPNPAIGEPTARKTVDDGVLRIGTCSSLTDFKAPGVEVLIDAAALLARTRCPVHLDIVGEGPCRADLEQRAADAAADTPLTVAFLGERTDPWDALADCRIIVGVGLVSVEAVLHGHRCVAAGWGVGGPLTVETADSLYYASYTGRDMAPLEAGLLSDAIEQAAGQTDASLAATREYLVARHGETARCRFVTLWRELLEETS